MTYICVGHFFYSKFWDKVGQFQEACIYCPSKTQKPTRMSKQQILKIIVSVLIAALTALGAAIGLNSCNVVRTITNKSEYYQRGDTSVMIQTKTTESYDASKKL